MYLCLLRGCYATDLYPMIADISTFDPPEPPPHVVRLGSNLMQVCRTGRGDRVPASYFLPRTYSRRHLLGRILVAEITESAGCATDRARRGHEVSERCLQPHYPAPSSSSSCILSGTARIVHKLLIVLWGRAETPSCSHQATSSTCGS